MSSHVVSKFHVDLLVRAALHAREHERGFSWWQVNEEGGYAGWHELDEFAEQRPPRHEGHEYVSPSQLGQILVNANVAGVHGRYPDTDPDAGDLPGPIDAYYMAPYVYENPGYTLSPGEVFAAIDYFHYQSCDIDSWEKSEAYAFCRSLRQFYCRKVDGYGAAPWGYDGPDDLGGKSLEFSRRII